MWQKCPICNGTGRDVNYNYCTVCNGYKIIDTITGFPPVKEKNNFKKFNTDELKNPQNP